MTIKDVLFSVLLLVLMLFALFNISQTLFDLSMWFATFYNIVLFAIVAKMFWKTLNKS